MLGLIWNERDAKSTCNHNLCTISRKPGAFIVCKENVMHIINVLNCIKLLNRVSILLFFFHHVQLKYCKYSQYVKQIPVIRLASLAIKNGTMRKHREKSRRICKEVVDGWKFEAITISGGFETWIDDDVDSLYRNTPGLDIKVILAKVVPASCYCYWHEEEIAGKFWNTIFGLPVLI